MAKPRTRKQTTPVPPAAHETAATAIATGAIAQRAYALFLARGGKHGHDLDDWLRAERELKEAPASVGV